MGSFLDLLCGTLSAQKWHGARNDFLFVHNEKLVAATGGQLDSDSLSALVESLCHRTCGVGADGVVVWGVDAAQRLTAGIWNSDGSRAGTCGNALRCLAALGVAEGLWDGRTRRPVFELDLENGIFVARERVFATVIESQCLDSQRGMFESTVGMGAVNEVRPFQNVASQLIALCESPARFTSSQNALLNSLHSMCFVQLANPHLVVALQPERFAEFSIQDFKELGAWLQSKSVCAALKIPLSNVGFVECTAEHTPANLARSAIVFERGAGLTECCGSGGCAMKVALEETKNSRPHQLESFAMPGGVITIRGDRSELLLQGPAQRICTLDLFS